MPIYEYRCKACENRFEELRPVSRMDSPTSCPRCESPQVLRLLSLFAARSGGDAEACDSSRESGTPCCRVSGFG